MQFFIPVPWPLALFFFPFLLMARGIIWLARLAWRGVLWPLVLQDIYLIAWLWGYCKTKFFMLREQIRERRELRRRAEQAVADFERVEKEAEQYFAGRVIEGEARRVEDAEK